jgi:hypothetical protein
MLAMPVAHRLVGGLILAASVVLAVRLCAAAPGLSARRDGPRGDVVRLVRDGARA